MLKNALKQILPQSLINSARDMKSRKALANVMPLDFPAENLAAMRKEDIAQYLSEPETARLWDEDNKTLGALLGRDDKWGGVNPGDRQAIYALIIALKPKTILEIGTHIGASTIHLAKAQDHIAPDGRITTVDILDVNAENGPWQTIGMTHKPSDYLKKLKLSGRVTFVAQKSTRYLPDCEDHFDFIFLDGNHDADTLYKEIAACLPKLNKNGVILMHDYYPDAQPLFPDGSIIYGPYRAIERIKKETNDIAVINLSPLPWETKNGSHNTSLTILTRTVKNQ